MQLLSRIKFRSDHMEGFDHLKEPGSYRALDKRQHATEIAAISPILLMSVTWAVENAQKDEILHLLGAVIVLKQMIGQHQAGSGAISKFLFYPFIPVFR
jgi:hypothetical protein